LKVYFLFLGVIIKLLCLIEPRYFNLGKVILLEFGTLTNDDMLSMEFQDLIDKEKDAQNVKPAAAMIK